ncbi:MAG: glycosyltransferase [Bacteroidetes bacterium MedPE-SWsnd-G2]|nr:MAG: glycosyltransferase [Bacteroidetes bacterium MedPE-SWsnd-G2]
MNFKKRILIAPLNWGLGHASRCIPLITALIKSGFQPVIASDGPALELLKKEFSSLPFETLPSYNITYPENGKKFRSKILNQAFPLIKTIKKEQEAVKKLHDKHHFSGIISDNRFGVYLNHVPSIYITHQINVLSGSTTWLSTKIHEKVIKKFDECWVPDFLNEPSLSGKLGHCTDYVIPTKHIGPLTRLTPKNRDKIYQYLLLLSGPEPQRSLLETKLRAEFSKTEEKVLLVRGVVESQKKVQQIGNLTIHNYMDSAELESAINSSELIISRSGYSTIMDLSRLGKNAFFIPTPGQFEQEYLAQRLKELKIADYRTQKEFKLEDLSLNSNYTGFKHDKPHEPIKDLFGLF